jgi:hypothetical protein
MNKQLLTLSVICLMLLGACKKNKTEPVAEQKKCQLVKSVREGKDGPRSDYEEIFEFDNHQNIISKEYGFLSHTPYTATFTYSDNQITENVDDYAGKRLATILKLDNQGRIISTATPFGAVSLNYIYNIGGYISI